MDEDLHQTKLPKYGKYYKDCGFNFTYIQFHNFFNIQYHLLDFLMKLFWP